MSETISRIASLSSPKLALLMEEMRRKARERTQIRVVERRGEVHYFPLSYAQQRLWLVNQLDPITPLFNVPVAQHLKGLLDVKAMEAAFTEICRRHESLRTTFTLKDGQPVQVVGPPRQIALPIIDLTKLPQPERQVETRRLASSWRTLAFDLKHGPLIRICLLKLGEAHHVLLLTLHHIISDGWSLRILVRELSALYDAYLQGQASPLSDLEVQYGDYAVWQREQLQGKLFERQLAYWKEKLSHAPAMLELQTDRPRPAVSSRRGAVVQLMLSRELTEKIRTLNQREGVTLFMSMLASFQALLCRYSGQEDISVGSPLAGRKHIQTESLIGFFINTVVLRTDLYGNPTFRELLARMREVYLTAHAHQDVPFEMVVAELRPDQSRGQAPFFQVWFVFQNFRPEPLELSGLSSGRTGKSIEASHSQYDLSIMMNEGAENICLDLIYDTDLFDADTAAQILKDYEALLQQVTAQPEQRILEIAINPTTIEAGAEVSFGPDTAETQEQFVF
jgi:hypothetical protein